MNTTSPLGGLAAVSDREIAHAKTRAVGLVMIFSIGHAGIDTNETAPPFVEIISIACHGETLADAIVISHDENVTKCILVIQPDEPD